jgi:hypothetical protein
MVLKRERPKADKRIYAVLNLLTPEKSTACFGTSEPNAIWEELNASEDNQTRAVEWLEAIISTHLSQKLEDMNKRAHAVKVQKAY